VTYHPEGPEGPEWTIDFTPPFRRLRMFPDLEKFLGVKLPEPEMLHTDEARAALDALCVKHNVDCAPPRTAARLLDKVIFILYLTYCLTSY
jgi:lysyl-tRNA synthetase class 2